MEDRNDQNQEKENELPSDISIHSNSDVAAGDRPHAANPYRIVSI